MRIILKGLIHTYRRCISPFLGPRCRFFPSCSAYALECLDKYPLSQALPKIVKRILRCHPGHPGGIDLP